MGRGLRIYGEDWIYFVTGRVSEGRFLLSPDGAPNGANAVLAEVLAAAVERYGVRLYGYIYLSNHFHLMVGAPGNSLSAFMGYVMCNTSKRMSRLHGWKGKFWSRRFDDEPVFGDAGVLDRLSYILSNGVKEGLVGACGEWPGLSCLHALLSPSEEQTFPRADGEPLRLTVTPLPQWQALQRRERRARVVEVVRRVEAEASAARGARAILGAAAVLAQSPFQTHEAPRKRGRPLCHTQSRQLLEEYLEMRRAYVEAYREASRRWRMGDTSAEFPPFSFRPVVSRPFPLTRLAA